MLRIKTRWANYLFDAWVLAMSIGMVYVVLGVRTSIHANGERIADIQQSRINSCKDNYEGIRKVFKPFFPPPKQRTPEQKANLKTLNNTVNTLKHQCSQQIRIAGDGRG